MADFFDGYADDFDDDWEPEDFAEYFGSSGVGGPGDDFMSVGPGGMTSEQHQAAVKTQSAQQADDEHALLAEQGAVAFAADSIVNEFDDGSTMTQEPVSHGGGHSSSFGGSTSSGPIPGGTSAPLSSKSKLSLPLILGAIIGAAFFFLKK